MDNRLFDQFFEIEEIHWWFRGRRAILESVIKTYLNSKQSNANILDVGCGCGANLKMLCRFGNVSGVDYSEKSIEYCKQSIPFEVQFGYLPDGLDGKFNDLDLITALDVIEHIDNDLESLKTLHNRLKADGLFVCTVPAYKWLWSEHDDINHHKRRYTKRELKRKLIESNFDILYLGYFNSLLFPFVAIPRLLKRLMPSHTSPKSDFQMYSSFVNKILETVFAFEKHLIKRISFPFGVSLIGVARKQNHG